MLLSGCISDLTFDAWRAGEIEGPQAQRLDQHVLVCASCRSRRQALLADAEAFELRPDREQPLLRVRSQLAQRKRRKLLTALSAAAVAALGLLTLRPQPPEYDGRPKGGSTLDFYVHRAEQTFRWQPGQAVQPGDQLRFTWHAQRPLYLTILSLDAHGKVSVYFPRPEQAPQRLAAAEDVDLPLAVQLDDSLGTEHVYAVGCESPPPVETLRHALATDLQLKAAASCELVQLTLRKEPGP
jgi:hypothetical protein